MHFYTQEYGSYPFSDYKLVFVEDAWANVASSASLAICSSRLLHSADIIDQIYSTRRELSQELARQWFGIYIVQKSWPDTWLVRGLANYMGSLFIKRHLGNNEYRLRLKKVIFLTLYTSFLVCLISFSFIYIGYGVMLYYGYQQTAYLQSCFTISTRS